VLHTRIIDLLQDRTFESQEERKIYYRIRNHDGYKLAHQLIKAEQFDMKSLCFVQAMVPSIFVLTRKQKIFLKKRFLYNQLHFEKNPKEMDLLFEELEKVRQDELTTNNCFNITNFLHYRFWFFDLDYQYPIPFSDILEVLRELNLLPFVAVIVQTSPTKYHIYIKSEMIASREHVSNWPTPLKDDMLLKVLNPENIEQLKVKFPNKTGWEWQQVAMRGLPAIHRLDTIPIPIPEEAVLKNGMYFGDDNVLRDFKGCSKEIAHVLGADPSVFNETRNAQLVGYTNPKNGHVATIVYSNKNAPVLTTKLAKTVVRDSIKKFLHNYTYPFYVAPKQDKTSIVIEDKEKVLVSTSIPDITPDMVSEDISITSDDNDDVPITTKKIIRSHNGIPSSPEEYCRIHGLMDEVIWEKDIHGSSNDMLKLFTRFAKNHIDLNNEAQRRSYFKTIVAAYFRSRISKNLIKDVALTEFYRRFESMCSHDSKSSLANRASQVKQDVQIKYTSEELQDTWVSRIREISGEHACIKSKAHKKLRKLICDFVVNHAILHGENNTEYLEYQIPAAYLNDIHGYKQKLKIYEGMGLYTVGADYKKPTRKGGRVIKTGQCKKHRLLVAESQQAVVEMPITSPTIIKPVHVINPKPIQSINELVAEPIDERILTIDYVMSVVKAQPLVDTAPVSSFIPTELVAPIDEDGFRHKTITNIMATVDKTCEKYSDLGLKFKDNVLKFINPKQLELDHENNDYLIKRAKILNNVRPFKKHEIDTLSKDDRIDYLLAVADLVVLSPLGREYTHRTREEFLKIYGHDYFLLWIEQQVTEMTHGFKKLKLDKAHVLRWLKRDLQSHIWMADYIYTEKRRLHREFLDLLDDEIEVFWRFPGSLLRDHKNRNFKGYLTPDLLELYNVPVNLQLEECKYSTLVKARVEEIKQYIIDLPYDHREKDSLEPLQTCKCESIKTILERLKDSA